ncbi:MAG: hypothetical protein Q9172_005142 [Xanthocarpia lactea]
MVVTVFTVPAYSSLGTELLANEGYPQLGPRQDIPEVPPKPPTSGPGSFHGSQFQFLEQTNFAPAVDSMPVWMFSRTQKEFGAIYNKHCLHDHYSWDELNTVDVDVPGTTDVKDETTGLNRKHPKVYVGFFSHASFPEINKSRKTIFNGECPKYKDLLGNEYR